MNPIRDIWQSIVRRDPLSTDKGKSELVFLNVWLHIHPAKVKKENLKVKHTFYLGFITFFLFLILVTTGVALMFYYRPHPPQAYQDMKDLQFVVYLGSFLRNMHRWAAHGMVICVFLHMCRVFYTGSYKRPRQFNWVIGVVLFLLTLGLSFTGYLLPWDQLAFWAITVGTNIGSYAPLVGARIRELLLGGHTVGESALLRFYVLHVAVLPALVTLLTMVHFWRVRKDGGLSRPVWKLKEQKSAQLVTIGAPDTGAPLAVGPRLEGQDLWPDGGGDRQTDLRDREHGGGGRHGLLLSVCLLPRGHRFAGDGCHRDGGFALLEGAAGGAGQSGEDAQSGEGSLVFSRPPGTGQPLGAAGRRDRARRWRCWRSSPFPTSIRIPAGGRPTGSGPSAPSRCSWWSTSS